MQPFNTFLRGFLGLADAKVGGRSPQQFDDAVTLTVDAMQFWRAQRRECLQTDTGNLGTNAEGFNPSATGILIVPEDEMWFVEQYTVMPIAVMAAGEIFHGTPAVRCRRTNAAGLFANILLNEPPGEMTAVRWPGGPASTPLIGLPGDSFGVFVHQITTAATIDVELSMLLIRSKI